MDPDGDLEALNRDQLVAEVKRLRAGIRTHRDSTGHDLCWHHPDLWGLLPEQITPEAAVFTSTKALAYHGRIDDKFVSLGVERPAATRHDLFDALTAVVAGKAPNEASAPAVGCFIADFVQ